MQYQRVLVVGCCGSGKTTLSLRLGEITGLPVVHLDRLFWKPGWASRPREEFDAILNTELQKPRWIIDGNFKRTLPLRLGYCDCVLYLDFSRLACMRGILSRGAKTHGRTRPDMGDGCPERIDWEFIKSTWNFERDHGTENKEIVGSSGKPVVWLRSRRQAESYLKAARREANTA